jgi:hypothetical protein
MSAPKSHRDPRRYGTTTVRIKRKDTCFFCNTSPLPEGTLFCPSCGFPQGGSEAEQKRFIVGRRKMKKDVNEEMASIAIARIILIALGIINGGIGAWMFSQKDKPDTAFYSVIAAIYIGLGIWASKKPFPALFSGLLVYVMFLFIGAILNPDSIYSGLILKFIIISSIVYGIRAVKKAENLKKQLEVEKMDLTQSEQNEKKE